MKFFVNFDFASRPFHSFDPLKEKHFWPHVVRRNGIRRSVSVFRSCRVLLSDNLSNRHERHEGSSALVYLYTIVNGSFTAKSFTAQNNLLVDVLYDIYCKEDVQGRDESYLDQSILNHDVST